VPFGSIESADRRQRVPTRARRTICGQLKNSLPVAAYRTMRTRRDMIQLASSDRSRFPTRRRTLGGQRGAACDHDRAKDFSFRSATVVAMAGAGLNRRLRPFRFFVPVTRRVSLSFLEPADSRPVSGNVASRKPWDAVEKYRTGLIPVSTAFRLLSNPQFQIPPPVPNRSPLGCRAAVTTIHFHDHSPSIAADSPFIHRRKFDPPALDARDAGVRVPRRN